MDQRINQLKIKEKKYSKQKNSHDAWEEKTVEWSSWNESYKCLNNEINNMWNKSVLAIYAEGN